ncbi:threonine synthase [Vagococcus teuberi]
MEKKYQSTRNETINYSASQAILAGLSPDGGLFVLPNLDDVNLDVSTVLDKDYQEIASLVINQFFNEFSENDIKKCVKEAYTNIFSDEKITPLQKVGDDYVLELFHGPTCSFKDVALSLLPKLVNLSAKTQNNTNKRLILTATSGDTGKAALEGFKNDPLVDMIVYYPNNGVSTIQEKQMQTQDGGNVAVVSINGNFDDAQSNVKRLFHDEELVALLKEHHIEFSSANSVNIGRLIPQVVYYFASYAELVNTGEIKLGEKVDYIVPTGNFGNILAGYYAQQMGLPINKLICASNENNVLYDFLKTGEYDTNREFKKTSSPSMDILISSNLERMLFHLSGGDAHYVADLMNQLKTTGKFKISDELLHTIQETFGTGYATDKQVAEQIDKVYKEKGYLLDPHTAVASYVLENSPEKKEKTVILSTASPYKFVQEVSKDIPELAIDSSQDEFKLIDELEEKTNVYAPSQLKDLKHAPILHNQVIDIDEMKAIIIKQVGES